jgi:hypothetical protein
MTLTKTDFKEFLLCNKCLWVKKIKPELYIEGEFSLFLQKLIKDGYDVEKYVQKLFPDGQEISGDKENLLTQTKKLLEEKQTMFQATFESKEGLFAKMGLI